MAHRGHGKGHGKGHGDGKKHFQIKLGGDWKDYSEEEDRCLVRAFSTGQEKAKFTLRGQHYEYDFKRMEQRNKDTGKTREIRPPPGMRAPEKAVVPKGPTMVVTIPDRSPMPKAIKVPHPQSPGQMIVVKVPKGARAGQEMLIPIPPVMAEAADSGGGGGGGEAKKKESGGSGGRPVLGGVMAGGAAVVAVGGAVVVGALVADSMGADMGDGIADLGDGVADLGDGIADLVEDAGLDDLAEDAGEALIDGAEDATEWLAGAGDDAGDFIMDLF